MNFSVTLLAVISLVCGLSFGALTRIAELAANQVFGLIK
jgi:hypothetical protein